MSPHRATLLILAAVAAVAAVIVLAAAGLTVAATFTGAALAGVGVAALLFCLLAIASQQQTQAPAERDRRLPDLLKQPASR